MSDWDHLNGTTSNSSSSTTMNQQAQFTSKSRNNSRESGLSHLIGIEEYDGDHSSKMSTFNKKSSPSSPTSPQTKISNDKSKYLVHQLTPKDTLQGLALKYNVKVNDIKRINNMWTQDSLFIKKTILIPIEVSDLSSSENNSNSSGSGNNSLNSSSNNIKNHMEVNGGYNNGNGNSNTFDNVFPEFEKMNKTFGSPLTPKERPVLPPSTFNNSNNNRNNSESIFNNRPNSTLSFSPVVNSLDQKTQTHFSLLDDEWNPL